MEIERARCYLAVRTAVVVTSLLVFTETVFADDVRVMTSGAFTAALQELAPQYERTAGQKVVIGATSSIGPDSIGNRIRRGEPVDVLIMAASALEDMIKEGTAAAGSRVDLVRSSIGVAVRAGTPKPDISSVDALKRALLAAKSIAYSASVSGTYLTTELFPRLGVAEAIMPKSHRIDRERVGAVVARGEAEIGFQQISELLPVPGIEFVGPLPPGAQRVTVFAAGVASTSKNPAAARALIAFLSSQAAAAAIRKSGLEPIAGAPSSVPVAVRDMPFESVSTVFRLPSGMKGARHATR